MIFLPGTDKQIKFFLKHSIPSGKNILIAGGGTERIALRLVNADAAEVEIISNDSFDVMDLRLRTAGKNIKVRLMDYENTGLNDNSFDFIYSQASFTVPSRRKIFREMSRILKSDGSLCCGEILKTTEDVPKFMQDIWNSSGLQPLTADKLIQFYKDAGFVVEAQENLSFTLTDFYMNGQKMLQKFIEEGSDEERRFYKKLLNKISHESNAYLSLGGKKYMEFHAFILKRTN